MLASYKNIEIPKSCPKNCPAKNEPFYQGNLCSRCPVLCCSKDKDGFCVIEPEDYRPDWAEDFKDWFESGFKDECYPRLGF